jgi:hypothetical protein
VVCRDLDSVDSKAFQKFGHLTEVLLGIVKDNLGYHSLATKDIFVQELSNLLGSDVLAAMVENPGFWPAR